MSDTERKLLIMPLVMAIAVAWVAKVYAMGWLTMFLALPYALVTLIHATMHALALRPSSPLNRRRIALILSSHLLLAGAFLVQWDAGDGLGWLTITAILGDGPGHPSSAPPAWWPRNVATFNIVAFLPLTVSWVLLAFPRPAPAGGK